MFGEVGAKPWILRSQSGKIRSFAVGKVWGTLGLHEDAVRESQLLLFPHFKAKGSPSNTCHFGFLYNAWWASQQVLVVKNPPANAREMWVCSQGREDPLEEGMASHISLALAGGFLTTSTCWEAHHAL